MIEEWIFVDGIRIEAARWRPDNPQGLPIVLLHEGLGSVRLWKGFPQALADATGREVIAWSRQGHGWSDWQHDVHDVDYMHREADLVPAVMAALGIERAHILGHSDGGSIALMVASRFAEKVASLILHAPHVFVEELTVESIAKIGEGFAASGMTEKMKRYHAEPARMFKRWNDIWLKPAFLEWNIEDKLAGIRAPALLIQGREDQYGTMEQLERIERGISQSTRLELDACGHSPHFDRADAVIEAIREFLRSMD